jgi:pyridoxine 4-dehydrogenase
MVKMKTNTTLPSNLSARAARRKPSAFGGTWQLGDRTVNRIGFGLKRLGGNGAASRDAPGDDVLGLLRRAVDLGVNHLDTAAFYPTLANGEGKNAFTALDWANDAIRQSLAPYPDDLVIATKVGPGPAGLARPDQLRGLVEHDLRQLGLESLDLVYLRQTGLTSIAEHFGVLAELREAGLIRHLGLSNVRVEHLAQAQEIAPVVAVQNRYGVEFGRVNDTMLELCAEQGVAFVPFFTLTGAGREAGGVKESDPVSEVARAHGATTTQVRLAWTLRRGPHVLAIPGTSNPDHLAQNVAAGELELTSDDLAALDAAPPAE